MSIMAYAPVIYLVGLFIIGVVGLMVEDAYEHIMGCWDIRKDSRYEADTLEF